MTIKEALAILIEEVRARQKSPDFYDEDVTEAMDVVVNYAKRSAPR